MYRAKERGGGVYEVFDDAMRERAVRRMATENALHRALERGEFVMHYQPIVHMATGALYGVEALARWQHPERGLVMPGEFIEAAEETGLIIALGRVGVRGGVPPVGRVGTGNARLMSVNLSARQCAPARPRRRRSARSCERTGADPATAVARDHRDGADGGHRARRPRRCRR